MLIFVCEGSRELGGRFAKSFEENSSVLRRERVVLPPSLLLGYFLLLVFPLGTN